MRRGGRRSGRHPPGRAAGAPRGRTGGPRACVAPATVLARPVRRRSAPWAEVTPPRGIRPKRMPDTGSRPQAPDRGGVAGDVTSRPPTVAGGMPPAIPPPGPRARAGRRRSAPGAEVTPPRGIRPKRRPDTGSRPQAPDRGGVAGDVTIRLPTVAEGMTHDILAPVPEARAEQPGMCLVSRGDSRTGLRSPARRARRTWTGERCPPPATPGATPDGLSSLRRSEARTSGGRRVPSETVPLLPPEAAIHDRRPRRSLRGRQ